MGNSSWEYFHLTPTDIFEAFFKPHILHKRAFWNCCSKLLVSSILERLQRLSEDISRRSLVHVFATKLTSEPSSCDYSNHFFIHLILLLPCLSLSLLLIPLFSCSSSSPDPPAFVSSPRLLPPSAPPTSTPLLLLSCLYTKGFLLPSPFFCLPLYTFRFSLSSLN